MNQNDISIIRSVNITDTNQNGGRADLASTVVSGVKFNLFPRVTSAERETGITRYRKAFIANSNVNGETAYSACVCIGTPGGGLDRFYIAPAADTDTQADAPVEWTGCGKLAQSASAGDSTINLLFKSSDYSIPVGALLLIKDDEKSCNARVASVSRNVNTASVTLEAQLPYSFEADITYAGIMIELGDLEPVLESVSLNSLTGSFDHSLVVLSNGGTEYDTFSLTFTSALSFSAAGFNAGALPSGQTTAQYSPVNPKTGRPFFTIPAEAWAGSFEAGNSLTLVTLPSAKGFWLKETVPAGCPHEPNNIITLDWQID
jgi:hypothetical protein